MRHTDSLSICLNCIDNPYSIKTVLLQELLTNYARRNLLILCLAIRKSAAAM